MIVRGGYRLLVSGSRHLMDDEYLYINSALNEVVYERGWPIAVVHGAAPGADALASKWAHQCKIDVEAHGAKWGTFGRPAGNIRNIEMLDTLSPGDVVVAFPTAESVGTRHMIRAATDRGFDVRVHEMLDNGRHDR